MNEPNPNRDALVRALRRLEREAESLRRALNRAEERLYGFRETVRELLRGAETGAGDDFSPPRSRRRQRCDAVELLRLAAAAGVSKLEIKEDIDGAALVRVEGGREFALPPTLTGLLLALVSNTSSSADDLVGWKTHTELARLLGRRMHKTYKKQALINLVWRLRVLMAVGGVNPFLVQTDPRRGVRFALKRKSAAPQEKPPLAEARSEESWRAPRRD